jgi:hypothetical protein
MYNQIGKLCLIATITGVSYAQVPPSFSVNVPAPIGIAATPSRLLFTQPYCDQQPGGFFRK